MSGEQTLELLPPLRTPSGMFGFCFSEATDIGSGCTRSGRMLPLSRSPTVLWWTLRQLHSSDKPSRIRAIEALAVSHRFDPRAEKALIGMLCDKDRDVRGASH